MTTEKFSLQEITKLLAQKFPSITDLYIFGSRAYKTKSLRSDLDLLVLTDDHIRPNDLRLFSHTTCPALDLFLVEGGKATSSMNESFVVAASTDELVKKLDAIHFWSRKSGFTAADIDWEFEIPMNVGYEYTALTSVEPFSSTWSTSVQKFFSILEAEHIPVLPFIGENPDQVAEFIEAIIKRMVEYKNQLNTRGSGTQIALNNEYDFQNLFFLVCKPWLPDLGREEVAVKFDAQNKICDFGLLHNRILIEMKHIKDKGTQADVTKQIEGLKDIYSRSIHVECILIPILVEADFYLDDSKYEANFSGMYGKTKVRVFIVRNTRNTSSSK